MRLSLIFVIDLLMIDYRTFIVFEISFFPFALAHEMDAGQDCYRSEWLNRVFLNGELEKFEGSKC